MFAQIAILTGQDAAGLIIPSEAVIRSGEKQLVFVAEGSGRFSPRQITTGVHLSEGRVQVLTGLAAGNDVVVSGQFLLDSESRLKEAIQKMMAARSGKADDSGPNAGNPDTGGSDGFSMTWMTRRKMIFQGHGIAGDMVPVTAGI